MNVSYGIPVRELVIFEIFYYRNVLLLIAYSKIYFVWKSKMITWAYFYWNGVNVLTR